MGCGRPCRRPDIFAARGPDAGRRACFAGDAGHLLHHLPQPEAQDRRACARHRRRHHAAGESRGVGTRDHEAACGVDAPGREAAARCRDLRGSRQRARSRHRSCLDRQPSARPGECGPPAQSHAVRQRGPRPLCARPEGLRREVVVAGRRDRRRQLRQLRRRPRRSRRHTSSAISRRRARSRGWRPACRARARPSTPSRFLCMSSRTIARTRICLSAHAAASPSATSSRPTAST